MTILTALYFAEEMEKDQFYSFFLKVRQTYEKKDVSGVSI